MNNLILEFIEENSIIEEEVVKIGLRQNDYRDFTLYTQEELYDVPLIYYSMIKEDFIVGEFEAPFLEGNPNYDYILIELEDYQMEIKLTISDVIKNEEDTYFFVATKIEYLY